MYVTWKIEHQQRTPNTDGSWEEAVDLTSTYTCYDVLTRTKLGDGKDSFEFKILNINSELDNYFSIGDKVTIYRAVNTTTVTSTDIVMAGIINELPLQQDGKKDVIPIKGVNYTETLMQAVAFVANTGKTVSEFLEIAINNVKANNENFGMTWNGDNPTLKSDGSAFPIVNEKWLNKSLLKLLEKYSQNTFTGDGDYYFYVNTENELVWRRQEDDAVYNFDESTAQHFALKAKVDKSKVYNFVIAKANPTPAGDIINVRYDNAISRAKHGFKYYFLVSEANYAQQLVDQDKGSTGFGVGDVNPTSFPFTTVWASDINRSSNPSMTAGSTVTCANAEEYNIAIREQSKFQLREEARAFADEHANGKLQVEIDFQPGIVTWSMGDVINVTIPQVGKENNSLRVEEVQYGTTAEKYVLIEDEGTI